MSFIYFFLVLMQMQKILCMCLSCFYFICRVGVKKKASDERR